MRLHWRLVSRSLVAGAVLLLGPGMTPTQMPTTAQSSPDKATQIRQDQERADRERLDREKAEKLRQDKERAAIPDSAKRGSTSSPTAPDEKASEDKALTLVRAHLPELAEALAPLKTSHPAEYQKAITELANDARSLAETQSKNPARYPFALDSWKARTRVELIAAQLARTPSAERETQLREAIRERVEADIRRYRFEFKVTEEAVTRQREALKKAEANRDRARAALDHAEESRGGRVEARFRSLFELAKKGTVLPQTATGPMPHSTVPVPHD